VDVGRNYRLITLLPEKIIPFVWDYKREEANSGFAF
jgi:hypothetical protein